MSLIQDIASFLEEARASGEKPILVLGGPTASGKTALSLRLAEAFNGEIISADSTQVYRGMDIGTDKVTVEERARIKHHLIDIRDPDQPYAMSEFKKEASAVIEELTAQGKVPILCGGTGLYLSSVAENYDLPVAPPDAALRAEADALILKEGKAAAAAHYHARLQKEDAAAAARIHPNNIRYVIRALEISKSTGQPSAPSKKKATYPSFKIAIDWPRDVLYARINARADQQLEKGLLHEIKTLLDRGYNENLQCFAALGYKEYFPYFRGEKPLEDCKELLKQRTRNLAKRQLTWFRKDPEIHWVTPQEFQVLTQVS